MGSECAEINAADGRFDGVRGFWMVKDLANQVFVKILLEGCGNDDCPRCAIHFHMEASAARTFVEQMTEVLTTVTAANN